MKALIACIAIIMLAVPTAAMNGDHDNRVIIDKNAPPADPAEFDNNDRIVDADELQVLNIDRILEPGTASQSDGMEYISSCLWTDLSDIHVENGTIYCALTYGLVILDASGDLPFDIISTLYLNTTYGRGDQFEKHGDYIYFTRKSEVVVIDVSDVEYPLLVGSYPSQGEFIELTCVDDVLYLLDKNYGLTILDVSDPANPALISTTTDFGSNLHSVAVSGGIAFVSASSEFQILDVSDPANPGLLASCELRGVARAVLRDSLAFAFKYDIADSIIIFNLSDPANPVRLGAHECSDPDCTSSAMMLSNSLLITAGEIINISDPSAPASISIYSDYFGGTLGLWGNSLYRARPSSINIFDIANIENPYYVDSHVFPGRVHDVYIREDLAFAALLFQGLVILDISDIHHPVVIGELNDSFHYKCIDVRADILCSGRYVVDISDPVNPVLLSDLGYEDYLDVCFNDDLVFVLGGLISGTGSLRVFDLSDPSNPVLLSSYETELLHHAKVAVKDTLAFLTMYHSGAAVHILDYSDPSAPELIGTYGEGYSMVVAVDENIMYTRLNSDLHVVDIQDPRNPMLIGTFDQFRFWAPVAMVPQGDILYTTDMYGNTVVFDVSDPTNPLYVEIFMTPSSSAENLFIVDDIVFLADRYGLMMAYTPYYAPPVQHVAFDIKPGSCPNPLNWKINPHGKTVLPVAILGGEDLDVYDIDVSTVRLLGDLAPVRYGYEDAAAPADSADGDCACTDEGADGYLDLTVKFDKRLVLEKLHTLPEADQYTVTVTALLMSGERIEGHDCVHPVGGEASGSNEAGPFADGGSEKARPLMDAHAEDVTIWGNYPNPFNPATAIIFSLPEASRVILDIYNSAGQRVITLADEYFATGDHTVTWNGTGTSGQRVASGVYFCRIQTGTTTMTKKMLLLK